MQTERRSRRAVVAELSRRSAQLRAVAAERELMVQQLRAHELELESQNHALREAQAGLEAARARFEELYDFAPIAYFTFDLAGVVTEVNLSGTTLAGAPRAQVLGKPFPSLVRMDEPGPFWRHLRECGRSRQPGTADLRWNLLGTLRVFRLVTAPVLDPLGEVCAFRTAISDITELEHAHRAAELAGTAEARLRERYEALDRGSLELTRAIADPDNDSDGLEGVLRVLVAFAARQVGATHAGVGYGDDPNRPFAPWIQVGDGAGRADARRILAEVVRWRATVRRSGLTPLPSGDGPSIRSFLGMPIRYGERVLGGLYVADKPADRGFSSDDQAFLELLAERAGVVCEIARLRQALQDAIAGRDDLLAVVSHDLRGPLEAIWFSSELLRREHGDGAARRPLEIIEESSNRIRRLIDDLLQAAAIEAGMFTITPAATEVAPLVSRVLDELDASASALGVRLEGDVPADLPPVWADAVRIAQVLSNLVGNAIKFGRRSGHVRVVACATPDGVRLSVTDDGPGIPAEQIPHLFERYQKGPGGGTGLGLYIANAMVAAHGGRLEVDSRPGAWTAFCFTLPLAQPGPE